MKGKLMKVNNHWLDGVMKVESANYNDRPEQEVSLLVIHNISLPPAQFEGDYVEQFFCNQLNAEEHPYFEEIAELEVSSHLYIRRDGRIVQFVPFNKRAWHAGRSEYSKRANCNDFSIGIEMEGTDGLPYTEVQYQTLSIVCQALMEEYPNIIPSRITGHEFIAPGRKTDPGRSFDWQQLFSSFLTG